MPNAWDHIVIGAGHNGLTAATVMARDGMRVLRIPLEAGYVVVDGLSSLREVSSCMLGGKRQVTEGLGQPFGFLLATGFLLLRRPRGGRQGPDHSAGPLPASQGRDHGTRTSNSSAHRPAGSGDGGI